MNDYSVKDLLVLLGKSESHNQFGEHNRIIMFSDGSGQLEVGDELDFEFDTIDQLVKYLSPTRPSHPSVFLPLPAPPKKGDDKESSPHMRWEKDLNGNYYCD